MTRELALKVGTDADGKPVLARIGGNCDALAAGSKLVGIVSGRKTDGTPVIAFSDQKCASGSAAFEGGKRYLAKVVGRDDDGKPILAAACTSCYGGPLPANACDCDVPDTLYATYTDTSGPGGTLTPDGNCKYADSVIPLSRCSLAEALSCFAYEVVTYTFLNPDDGYAETGHTTDTAEQACLTAPHDDGTRTTTLHWYCWKSEPLTYANGCCDEDHPPPLGGGTIYYVIVESVSVSNTDPEDVRKSCREFFYACSSVIGDGLCVGSSTFIEGTHPVGFLNSLFNICDVHEPDFDGRPTTTSAGFTVPCATGSPGGGKPGTLYGGDSTWLTCAGGAGGVPADGLDNFPTGATCEPFHRDWFWAGSGIFPFNVYFSIDA